MASTPQSKFVVVLPTVDTAVPPNAIVVGELTQVDFDVTVDGVTSSYSAALDPTLAVGATVEVPFASVTPAFAPVAGKTYTADAFCVDANGNGNKSVLDTWTQVAAAAPPAAPTFSIA